MEDILWLDDIREGDAPAVGGKGLHMSELKKAGFNKCSIVKNYKNNEHEFNKDKFLHLATKNFGDFYASHYIMLVHLFK